MVVKTHEVQTVHRRMEVEMSSELSGSCLCGGVRFIARPPFRPVIACHCTQCRKQTGHFMAASAALHDNFELINDGTLKWYRSGATSRRGFCSACGATLFFAVDGADRISFAGGSIDGPTQLRVAAHIYAREQDDYYDIPANETVHDSNSEEILNMKP